MACSNKPNHMPSITINKSAALLQLSMGKSDVKNCETVEAAARLSDAIICDIMCMRFWALRQFQRAERCIS
jgi:hypothetical protein